MEKHGVKPFAVTQAHLTLLESPLSELQVLFKYTIRCLIYMQGADLAHIMCSPLAAPAIKSYAPDLMVYPILSSETYVSSLTVMV